MAHVHDEYNRVVVDTYVLQCTKGDQRDKWASGGSGRGLVVFLLRNINIKSSSAIRVVLVIQ